MSLLIKALDKAQAEKAQAEKGSVSKKEAIKSKPEKLSKSKSVKPAETLSLDPLDNNIPSKTKVGIAPASIASKSQLDDVSQALKGSAADVAHKPVSGKRPEITAPTNAASKATLTQPSLAPDQEQAANVFTAKHAEPTNHTAKLALIVGLVALAIMGGFAYWYQTVINTPDIVIPPRPALTQEMPQALPELTAVNALPVLEEPEMVDPEVISDLTEPVIVSEEEAKPPQSTANQSSTNVIENEAPQSAISLKEVEPALEETLTVNETVVDTNTNTVRSDVVLADLGIASESASIKVTQQKITSGVNPVLMRAYEAYNAGNDNQAQQDYKQVLKRYGPNVDAMLGLGAIATRQGRLADANGWYRRVLEVEPRNEVAKAGLINLQQSQTSQPQVNESKIKSMLATAPSDANLHAALGDLYANQNQWSAAQQAYFDAYRFNPSAENAFNLGVSLDQLGKSKLALPYYQEALQKAEQSNVIDAEALKARISSIE